MRSSSRDHAHTHNAATRGPQPALPHTVPCDICESPFRLPPEIVAQGEILGLLVCSRCIEDALQSEIHQ